MIRRPRSRRDLLRLGGATALSLGLSPVGSWLVGCGNGGTPSRSEARSTAASGHGTSPTAAAGVIDPAHCEPTADNIEGPYYRAGAPERANLVDPGMSGTPLALSGQVWRSDCDAPLGGAWLDFWQANAGGHYDNDGTMGDPAGRFLLRGRLRTDDEGRYQLTTIIPGRYLNGPQYRPAHIHVKVSAPGHAALTTQLYFEGDPYNDVDPFIHSSLIMAIEGGAESKQASFDFVLQRA